MIQRSEDTCDEVIEYFKKGNKPTGLYIDLAKYFIDDTYTKHSKCDKSYKEWLKGMIDTKRESESIVLSVLKTEYQTKESLKKLMFSINDISLELNQSGISLLVIEVLKSILPNILKIIVRGLHL